MKESSLFFRRKVLRDKELKYTSNLKNFITIDGVTYSELTKKIRKEEIPLNYQRV